MHELERLVGIDGSHAVRIGERPVVDEAVVARGALEIHAEEDLRDALRGLHRRQHRGVHISPPDDAAAEALARGRGAHELGDETVVRLVIDERLIEPVRNLLAAAIDEARAFVVVAEQVVPKREPVLGVIAFVREQPAHELRAFVGRAVAQKFVELLRRRQQADEVEVGAARESAVVHRHRKLDVMRGEVARENVVNRMHARALGEFDFARLQVLRRRFREGDAGRPRRALIDPRTQQPDLLRVPVRTFLWHHEIFVQTRHRLNDQTLGALADDRAGPRVAAAQKRLARLERKAALVLSFCVAFDARGLEKRLDVADEIDGARGRRRQLLSGFRGDRVDDGRRKK